jgi:hypothetical protein
MKARTTTLHHDNAAWERLLFAPLRDHADDPAIKRVDEVLSLLVAADTHLREQLDYLHRSDRGSVAESLHLYKRSKESERAYYQTLELLNIKLSMYRWTATLAGDLDGFRSAIVPVQHEGNSEYSGRKHFDYTHIREYSEYTEAFVAQRDQLLAQMGKPTRPEKAPANWNFMEMRMVSYLLEALDKGEISRFRRCSDCQNWFYATTSHQRFCGEACRRRYTAGSPEFKEKRRNYMKQVYRPQQKQRDANSLALAKGTPRKAPTGTQSKKGR